MARATAWMRTAARRAARRCFDARWRRNEACKRTAMRTTRRKCRRATTFRAKVWIARAAKYRRRARHAFWMRFALTEQRSSNRRSSWTLMWLLMKIFVVPTCHASALTARALDSSSTSWRNVEHRGASGWYRWKNSLCGCRDAYPCLRMRIVSIMPALRSCVRRSTACSKLGHLRLLGFMHRTKCGSVLSSVSLRSFNDVQNCFEIESSFSLLTTAFRLAAAVLTGIPVGALPLPAVCAAGGNAFDDVTVSPEQFSTASFRSSLLDRNSSSRRSLLVESRFFSAKCAML